MLHVTIRKCRFRHKAGTIWHNKLMRSGEKVYGLFNDSFPPVLDGVTLTVQNYVKKLVEAVQDEYFYLILHDCGKVEASARTM